MGTSTLIIDEYIQRLATATHEAIRLKAELAAANGRIAELEALREDATSSTD